MLGTHVVFCIELPVDKIRRTHLKQVITVRLNLHPCSDHS